MPPRLDHARRCAAALALACCCGPFLTAQPSPAQTAAAQATTKPPTCPAAHPSPASPEALAVHALLQQDKLPEALAAAQAASTAQPTSADAQALLGEALARSGQIPEASTAFLAALKLDPCSARAHFGAGKLDELVGRHLTGAREIIGAHALAPNDPEITAAFLDYVKPSLHAAGLRSFLASHPALPEPRLAALATELALADRHLACAAVQPFASAKLDLQPVMFSGSVIRSWGLDTAIDGAKPSLFELDSGVSGIVLNPDDARKAGVHPLTAASPTTAIYTAIADTLRIGGLEYRDCPVRVAPADTLANANSLIGADFFRDHVLHIDYVAKTLTLTPLPPLPATAPAGLADQFVAPEEKDWSPIYVAGAAALIPTLINKKGPYLFLLDTGGIRSVLSPAVATAQLAAGKDQALNLRGSSGELVKLLPHEADAALDITDVRGPNRDLLPVYSPRKLAVFRFTRNETPGLGVVAFDLSTISHRLDVEVSGLLGFDILHAFLLEINYRDALAHIVFDQNRRYDVQQANRAANLPPPM